MAERWWGGGEVSYRGAFRVIPHFGRIAQNNESSLAGEKLRKRKTKHRRATCIVRHDFLEAQACLTKRQPARAISLHLLLFVETPPPLSRLFYFILQTEQGTGLPKGNLR